MGNLMLNPYQASAVTAASVVMAAAAASAGLW